MIPSIHKKKGLRVDVIERYPEKNRKIVCRICGNNHKAEECKLYKSKLVKKVLKSGAEKL